MPAIRNVPTMRTCPHGETDQRVNPLHSLPALPDQMDVVVSLLLLLVVVVVVVAVQAQFLPLPKRTATSGVTLTVVTYVVRVHVTCRFGHRPAQHSSGIRWFRASIRLLSATLFQFRCFTRFFLPSDRSTGFTIRRATESTRGRPFTPIFSPSFA